MQEAGKHPQQIFNLSYSNSATVTTPSRNGRRLGAYWLVAGKGKWKFSFTSIPFSSQAESVPRGLSREACNQSNAFTDRTFCVPSEKGHHR